MLTANNSTVVADCHTIMHSIGSATLARYHGTASLAVGQGTMLCGSGFYHGLIEYALEGATTQHQLVTKVKALCSNPHRAANHVLFLYQCLHEERARGNDLQRRQPAVGAFDVQQARRPLGAAVMQRRRVHAELQPAEQALAVPVDVRSQERPALPVRLGDREVQVLLLPAGHRAHPLRHQPQLAGRPPRPARKRPRPWIFVLLPIVRP